MALVLQDPQQGSVLVPGSCVWLCQPWPHNYAELLLHMKPLTPQHLYPVPLPSCPGANTSLDTGVGAVPLLADGNSKSVRGVHSPSQAMVVLQAMVSRLSAGDTGTIAASKRDELPGDGIRFDKSSRM